MKTLVLYYSRTGHTRRIAGKLAETESADLLELRDESSPSGMRVWTAGVLSAMRGKPWGIASPGDLGSYERIVICSPVWASNPVPAVYAVLPMLPAGARVGFRMVSKSGKSACEEKLRAAVTASGCVFEGLEDIKEDAQ